MEDTKIGDFEFMRERCSDFCKGELQDKSEDLENNKYFGDVHNNSARVFPLSVSTLDGHDKIKNCVLSHKSPAVKPTAGYQQINRVRCW